MNRLVLSTFLLSTVFVAAIFAAGHFGEDELGDSDFDSDWFWIGSNLRSLGKISTVLGIKLLRNRKYLFHNC